MATAPDPRQVRAEQRRDVALAQRIRIHVNDEVFEIRPSELTPAIIGDLRRETGRTFLPLMLELHQAFDLDVAQAAVWLARRAAGERLSLDDVQLSYGDVVWASDIEEVPAEDADDPPVSGGG
jgi:hypothetical protein